MASTPGNGAGGQAQPIAGQAQEKAKEAAGEARTRLRDQVDQRSTQAGDQVHSSASDLRSVADSLREQGKDQPAKLAEQAAGHAERLGGYLKESDADRILGDIEDFGRRQPMTIMLGGLALGFAASRFLKASSERRAEGAATRGPSYPRPAAGELPRTTGTTAAVETPPRRPDEPVEPPSAGVSARVTGGGYR